MTATTAVEGQALIAADPRKFLTAVFGAKFAQGFQGTFVPMPGQVLHSPTAQRFFSKDFAFLSRQMYYEYQYRTWFGFNEDVLNRYAEIIATKLTKISEAQQNWVNRLAKLLDQNGKSGSEYGAVYPNAMTVDVPIIAPQARMYLEVLKQLDTVYCMASAAWNWGIIDSKQKADQEWFCKKMIRAFRVILQQEVIKLHREARRMQEVQRSSGMEDASKSALVDEQARDIKEFDAHSKAEEKAGETPPPNAEHAIDEASRIAAAGAAANKRTARKKAADSPAAAPAAAPAAEDAPTS